VIQTIAMLPTIRIPVLLLKGLSLHMVTRLLCRIMEKMSVWEDLRFFTPNAGISVASETAIATEKDVAAVEIRIGNFSIPTNETTYQSSCFNALKTLINLSNIFLLYCARLQDAIYSR